MMILVYYDRLPYTCKRTRCLYVKATIDIYGPNNACCMSSLCMQIISMLNISTKTIKHQLLKHFTNPQAKPI